MFTDRLDAGRQLAARLEEFRDDDPVVVGLPRGGVPVAGIVARSLGAPLDVILVRKLGVPHRPELAMGAIGENGVRVLNQPVLDQLRITRHQLAEVERRERRELERRADLYRAGRRQLDLRGRTVIVVDDGLATGSTAAVACHVAEIQGASRVVLAVPVAPPDWISRLGDAADAYVAVTTPEPFYGVGQFYEDFGPTPDAEVTHWLLDSTNATDRSQSEADDVPPSEEEVVIVAGGVRLNGLLTVPSNPVGIVIFVHGSGSSRHSPRNRHVARILNDAGLGTLLFDLLTAAEERDRENVFDIALLAARLGEVTEWLRRRPGFAALSIGYFGASTGAGAALVAAAQRGNEIGAVVSRGGRPDLAGRWLGSVEAPTLLIVGGDDSTVLELNRRAKEQLRCPNALTIVPRAGHLFEEPGTLDAVADAARVWFLAHLTQSATLAG